jgi:hypothetical protein
MEESSDDDGVYPLQIDNFPALNEVQEGERTSCQSLSPISPSAFGDIACLSIPLFFLRSDFQGPEQSGSYAQAARVEGSLHRHPVRSRPFPDLRIFSSGNRSCPSLRLMILLPSDPGWSSTLPRVSCFRRPNRTSRQPRVLLRRRGASKVRSRSLGSSSISAATLGSISLIFLLFSLSLQDPASNQARYPGRLRDLPLRLGALQAASYQDLPSIIQFSYQLDRPYFCFILWRIYIRFSALIGLFRIPTVLNPFAFILPSLCDTSSATTSAFYELDHPSLFHSRRDLGSSVDGSARSVLCSGRTSLGESLPRGKLLHFELIPIAVKERLLTLCITNFPSSSASPISFERRSSTERGFGLECFLPKKSEGISEMVSPSVALFPMRLLWS